MSKSVVFVSRTVLLGSALLALTLAGCGSRDKIKTSQVRGKVVFEKGGTVKQLQNADAAVQFESVDQPGMLGSAEIQDDGSLSNFVTRKGETAEFGLVEGTHRVRIRLDPQNEGLVNARFRSFEKSGITVKVPSEEEVVIKVWR